MRFKAITSDFERIQDLLKMFQTICKFSQFLIFRLSSNEIQLITDPNKNVVKCYLNCDDFFDEYCFNGISNENNLIYFDIECKAFIEVLNSFQTTIKSLKLKLCNKQNQTALSLEVDYPTHESNRAIRHDIKITIIERKFWNAINENHLTRFDLSLYLTEFKVLAKTIDRLTNINKFVIIKAKVEDNKGILSIGLETDSICVETELTQLEVKSNNENTSHESESTDSRANGVEVRVDVRKLNPIFDALNNLKPSSMICSLINEKFIHLQTFHNFANFEAILPNVSL